MASEKQIIANRENAKLGGVKTDEGKEKVRFNALKHGLTSRHLLTHLKSHQESQDLFEEILQGLKEALNPSDFFEETLVSKMAKVQFKMHRYETLEINAFLEESDFFKVGQINISMKDKEIALALKYKAALDREWSKSVEELQRHRHLQQLGSF
ncbi:hypothetical protein [Bdellovibrio sp.]|uniref:hypothetical protein n=1 Tax=Bdellovibrio sp. TaxID=28201 RepID=UPI0032221F5F